MILPCGSIADGKPLTFATALPFKLYARGGLGLVVSGA